ncbi:hypothetical protein [Methyloglobulus sp.]|uniref:hypothetical protein n=1 Tax=Methyloglobulus sp. TaxID=2518622 RepID=UPI0032B7CE5F
MSDHAFIGINVKAKRNVHNFSMFVWVSLNIGITSIVEWNMKLTVSCYVCQLIVAICAGQSRLKVLDFYNLILINQLQILFFQTMQKITKRQENTIRIMLILND